MSENKGNTLLKVVFGIMVACVIFMVGIFGYLATGRFATPADASTVVEVVEIDTYNIGQFTVKLADEGRDRYIRVDMSLGYESDDSLAKELNDKTPMMREAVNTVLMSKESEEFDTEGIVKIKNEIKEEVNEILNQGKITEVYFTDIIIQ